MQNTNLLIIHQLKITIMSQELELYNVVSVTRKAFKQGAKNNRNEDISGKPYFTISLKKRRETNLRIISGRTYNKNIFKDDALTKDIYNEIIALFKNEDGTFSIKTDETKDIKNEDMTVEACVVYTDLPCKMQRTINGVKQTPIDHINVVCLEGESANAQIDRILASFGYKPFDNVTQRTPVADDDDLL
jgi:hypothetical protein